MRKSRFFLIAFVLAGLVAAETAAAQAPDPGMPATGVEKQRAPGVPMAPRTGEVEQRLDDRAVTEPGRHDQTRDTQRREPPMPKPVPSIIAP